MNNRSKGNENERGGVNVLRVVASTVTTTVSVILCRGTERICGAFRPSKLWLSLQADMSSSMFSSKGRFQSKKKKCTANN